MNNAEQCIRTVRANMDKEAIVHHLNQLWDELNQNQGIYEFKFDQEAQIIYIDYGYDEIPVYVKGWSPAEVLRRVFEEVCGHLK